MTKKTSLLTPLESRTTMMRQKCSILALSVVLLFATSSIGFGKSDRILSAILLEMAPQLGKIGIQMSNYDSEHSNVAFAYPKLDLWFREASTFGPHQDSFVVTLYTDDPEKNPGAWQFPRFSDEKRAMPWRTDVLKCEIIPSYTSVMTVHTGVKCTSEVPILFKLAFIEATDKVRKRLNR